MFTYVQELTLCFSEGLLVLSLQNWFADTSIHGMWEALLSSREGVNQCEPNRSHSIEANSREGGTSDRVIMRKDLRNHHMKNAPKDFGLIGEGVLQLGRGCCSTSWSEVRKWVTWGSLRCWLWRASEYVGYLWVYLSHLAMLKPLVKGNSQVVLFY